MPSLLLPLLFTVSSAFISISTYSSLERDQAECLGRLGYTGFVAPVWREDCVYDSEGLANIGAVNSAGGFPRTDGIFIPSNKKGCASIENQMEAAMNKVRSMGLKIGYFWIHCNEPLTAIVNKASAMGQPVGFYAEKESFEAIFGPDFALYSNYTLWWSKMNNQLDFSDFDIFGGWDTATMHRYGQGSTDSCGHISLEWSYYI